MPFFRLLSIQHYYARTGFGRSDRILKVGQLSDCKHSIRSDPLLCSLPDLHSSVFPSLGDFSPRGEFDFSMGGIGSYHQRSQKMKNLLLFWIIPFGYTICVVPHLSLYNS